MLLKLVHLSYNQIPKSCDLIHIFIKVYKCSNTVVNWCMKEFINSLKFVPCKIVLMILPISTMQEYREIKL